MKRNQGVCVALIGAGLACGVAAAATVTLSVASPQDGQSVKAGAVVEWTISAEVSGDDNLGLALVRVDLVHEAGTVVLFELPPGTPGAALAGFDRPAGFCNPGPDGEGSGFGGTPLTGDVVGGLFGIGGAQNTFGVAGETMGFDTTIDAGVGQGGAVVVASGSFNVPDAPAAYTLNLQNALANVLGSVAPEGKPSAVSAAEVAYGAQSISFEIVPGTPCDADLDGSGSIDSADLNILLGAFGNSGEGDLTGDGQTTSADLNILLGAFGTDC